MTEAAISLAVVGLLSVTLAYAGTMDERPEAHAWARAALLGEPVPQQPLPAGLHLRRQDAGDLHFRESVMHTPLQIGEKHYQRGLGTHANSEVLVRLEDPGTQFTAEVGVDNNYDTAGQRGTVIFTVEVGKKEVLRSDLLRGGNEPVSVQVELAGAKEFVLKVLDGGDGIGWDQSDWADASVTLKDGRRVWLDEMPSQVSPAEVATALPFSFVYDERPSQELLPTWKRTRTTEPAAAGKEKHTITYTDPSTGLEVVCETTIFTDFPAVDWVVRFRNNGSVDTPILENVQALNLNIAAPPKGDIVLHHSHGSTCTATDFLPIDTSVQPDTEVTLAPNGGRSSDGALPFFNLEWQGGGLVGAIGWSGQWAMRLHRDAERELTLEAGQQITHLMLHPGESVRTPRMLLVWWQGDDRMRGHNLLRRLLLAHYVPRLNGEIAVPMIGQGVAPDLNWVTEENQLAQIPQVAPSGVEMYWVDAGWFEGEWPLGAGSWVPKAAFPHALRPLGDAAHKAGMKFIVWFEPERVCPNTRIAKEHPEWVRWGESEGWGGLFKLDDPEARRWLTEHLVKCIGDWGIDVYRNDFNIDPLRFWHGSDAPDRQGITENHYIEGLYTMWDELRARCPGLTIDNCASGGRRIDLETISRSYPLWRSDTTCAPPVSSAWDQVQTAGLSLYVPLHTAGTWGFDPYVRRSVATMAVVVCVDIRQANYPVDQARAAIEEVKSLRNLWLGDYYPLTPINLDEQHWCAWQFDRPDLGQGFAMFFRRPQSPYPVCEVALRGVDPSVLYEVTFVDTGVSRVVPGSELAKLRVEIPAAPGSVLITYRSVGQE